MRGVPPMPMAMALMPQRDRRPTEAGFGVTEIARILNLSAVPDTATIVDLVPGAGGAVAPALAAMGDTERTERGVTAWAMGEEGPRGRRAERGRNDPFRQIAGGFPRVTTDGDRLRHGEGWDLIFALVRGVGGSILARPEIAAVVAALDTVPDGRGRAMGGGAAPDPAHGRQPLGLYPQPDLRHPATDDEPLRPAVPAPLSPTPWPPQCAPLPWLLPLPCPPPPCRPRPPRRACGRCWRRCRPSWSSR
jgi:hypothetical protein